MNRKLANMFREKGYIEKYSDGYVVTLLTYKAFYKYLIVGETDAYIYFVSNNGNILVPVDRIDIDVSNPDKIIDKSVWKVLASMQEYSIGAMVAKIKTAGLLCLITENLAHEQPQNLLNFIVSLDKLLEKYSTKELVKATLSYNDVKTYYSSDPYTIEHKKIIKLIIEAFWRIYEEPDL